MSSLADIYKAKCTELGVKCNSRIVGQLPAKTDDLTDMDLYGNVVGPRGLLAVLECVTLSTRLVHLSLVGNNLNSACIKDLCAALLPHPSIACVNLSENDIRLAGPDLIELLKGNTNVMVLGIENTFLRPLFVKLITLQLERNVAANPQGFIPQRVENPKPVVAAAAAKPAQRQNPTSPSTAKPAAATKPAAGTATSNAKPAAAAGKPAQGGAGKGKGVGFGADTQSNEGTVPLSPQPTGFTAFSFGEEPPAKSPNASEGGFVAFGGQPADDHHVRITDKVEVMTSASELDDGIVFKKSATRRPTVSAEVYTEDEVLNFKPQVIPKDEATRQKLMKILEKNNFFSHLDDLELLVAVDQMTDSKRCAGDNIYDEGDEEGDTFYVLFEGNVSLAKGGKELRKVAAGETFADVMLLYSQTYDHTATCTTPCTIYALLRPAYKFILTQSSKKKRAKYEGFLSGIGFLKGLTKPELLQLADALKSAQFEIGVSMIQYGEVGEHFYIICEGTVEVIGRDVATQKPKWVCDFATGDCVGELEFINNHKCVADVKAKTFVRAAMMNRHHFEMVMGPVKDVLARIAEESNVYEYYRAQLAAMNKTESK